MALTRFRLAVLLTVIGLFIQPYALAQTPTVYVQNTVDAIITAIADSEATEAQQRSKVFALIAERFDFRAMAQRALSSNWKVTSETQQQQFTDLFRQILSHTYWQRIRGHSHHKVSYVKERIRDQSHATVSTVITTETALIPVDYRLRRKNQTWLAYDVIIEGVSLIQNYRAEYRQIIKHQGIDNLIVQMQVKAHSLSSG